MRTFWVLASAGATVVICAALLAGQDDIRRLRRMRARGPGRRRAGPRPGAADRGPPGYLEVSHGWVLAAIPARGLALPDAVALNQQARLGRPGPWPDALLSLLGEFRGAVPPECR